MTESNDDDDAILVGILTFIATASGWKWAIEWLARGYSRLDDIFNTHRAMYRERFN